MAWTLYQESSVSNFGQRFPVNVVGDGNCLPRTGSLLATGTQEHAVGIRVRIVCELVLHKYSYLSPAYIARGTDASKTEAQAMLDSYAVYSEKYEAISNETIYQREIMSIVAPGSYMGIWQIFALATVLDRTISVFYPNRGHLRIREDMNRLVQL